MRERTVAVPTEDGQMDTFITHPEEDAPFPAVVLYMDFWACARSCSTSPAGSEQLATTVWSRTFITGKGVYGTPGTTRTGG